MRSNEAALQICDPSDGGASTVADPPAVVTLEPASPPAVPGGHLDESASIYKVQTLIDDMTLPNDNGWWLAINGEQTADKNGPDKGAGQTWAYVAIGIRAGDARSYWPKTYIDTSFGLGGSTSIGRIGWYVIARAFQGAPVAGNTRAQVRNFKNLILHRDGSWTSGGESAVSADPYPANWHANFSSPGNETIETVFTGSGLEQARNETSGGASIGSIGYGDRTIWAVHGWPAAQAMPQSAWVDDVVGAVTVFEGRLIVHDASQPDDRVTANLMVWTGADWYNDSKSTDRYLGEHTHGRLKLLTNDWRIFSTTDIPASELQAHPPPGYTN